MSGTAASADLLQRSSDNTSPDGKLGEWALGWQGPKSGTVSRSLYEKLALSRTSRLVWKPACGFWRFDIHFKEHCYIAS